MSAPAAHPQVDVLGWLPLDLAAAPDLSDIAQLAALALDVPRVWIVIAATDRALFQRRYGLTTTAESAEAKAGCELLPQGDLVLDGSGDFSCVAAIRNESGQLLAAITAVGSKPPDDQRAELALKLAANQIRRELEVRRKHGSPRQLRGEEELSELPEELQLGALFDAMAEGVVVQGRAGHVVGSNLAARRILGLSSTDMEAQSVHRPPLVPLIRRDGSAMPDAERPAAHVLKTGESVFNRVMGLRFNDERTVWLSANATPLRTNDGHDVTGVLVTFRDITTQVSLQEELERSLAQFRALLASLPVGVVVSHGKNMRFVNQALADILGYEAPSDLVGRETLSVLAPGSMPRIMQRYAILERGETPPTETLECTRKDGSSVLIEVTSMPSQFEGKPAILAIIRDVTESSSSRLAQERSEARFRALVNFAPVGIFESDLQGNCIYANERLAKIVGMPVAQVLGKGWHVAVHPEDQAALQSKREEARASGSNLSHELRFIHPDGVSYAQVQSLPLLMNGVTTGYLGAVVDVTELRAAHSALLESVEQKEVLLKEVHHRVKNNLQVIASLLRIGRGYVKDAPSLSVFNDSIARVHSIAMIHERLYATRNLDRIDIGDYLRGLVEELVRANTTQRQVATQVLADRAYFDLDRCVPMGLIVNELVSNALKHAFVSPDVADPRLVVSLTESSWNFELVVRDNGSGMPAGQPREGSLGLRLVANLVKQLNGKYRVENEAGTACYVVFPKQAPDLDS